MSIQASRRQFLQGDFRLKRPPIRPPWAAPEDAFTSHCTRCGECIAACPETLIRTGSGGYPELDFSLGACSFCGDCSAACKPGALRPSDLVIPWRSELSFEPSCLALQGIECRVCQEQCEQRAIRFAPTLRSVPQPRLDLALCNGCGACVAPCPGAAIKLTVTPEQGNQPS